MEKFTLSYREVIPDQTIPETWREITLNTGGTQSTLQDIKISEKANGYCYKDAVKHCTRNRFIYWHTNHDVLELIEQSLDLNLSGNRIRYRFVDTPILDGITIHETHGNVVILVPTVCSVHRLIFPHPRRLHRQDDVVGSHPDLTVPSIFSEASAADPKDPNSFYVFVNPLSSNTQLPHTAASDLTDEEEALFVLAYPSGDVLLVRQTSEGRCSSIELKSESIIPRFLSGIADKFRSKSSDSNVVVNVVLHTVRLETFVIALCRDGNLRVWSGMTGQCIAVHDVLSEPQTRGKELLQGQNHILRKSIGSDTFDLLLVVYLSVSSESEFHIFRPDFSDSGVSLTKINNIYCPNKGVLLDFTLTPSRIWSVWGMEGTFTFHSVYSAQLDADKTMGLHWMPVTLEPLPDAEQPVDACSDKDPRQIYMQCIFHPGRFPVHVIRKALSIYKKSTLLSDVNLSISLLKQRVCLAVENEIQAKLKETEVTDEDYLDCAEWCWQRFYSCCAQYYIADLKPLGLLLLPSVAGVVLLKKAAYSFLRPLDTVEHLMLCSEFASKEQFLNHPVIAEDPQIIEDVISIAQLLVYLEEQLSENFSLFFEREMADLKSPDIIMDELLARIKAEMDCQFSDYVQNVLNNCEHLYQALHKLLELLRIDQEVVSEDHFDGTSKDVTSLNHLFSSVLGVSFVSRCLQQIADVRFMMCRNLLLMQYIFLNWDDTMWAPVKEAVRSICTVETVVLTQASYAFKWLTSLQALSYLPLESSTQRLAPLKLAPVYNLRTSNLQSISLIELFAGSTGGSIAHKSLIRQYNWQDDETFSLWQHSLLTYASHLSQLVWPLTNNSTLTEWLLSSGQHLWLQQYVRLLSNWCEWNSCTRNFLLAASLLGECEFHKAEVLFLTAAKGVFTDKFLAVRAPSDAESDIQHRELINYYLKVIQLFELHSARDCAINIANSALSIVDSSDPLRATLFSIKFKHHLALKHYEAAFNAMNENPDKERKTDNLRDLVKSLLDQKKLDVLQGFSYGSMEQQFRDIILTRARATDAIDNVYYDFLYSYEVSKGTPFYRMAASVMYEQSIRLTHLTTINALEKQVKCLLAAKNALALVIPDWRWVVKPVQNEPIVLKIIPPIDHPNEQPTTFTYDQEVAAVPIETVTKELKFALAKMHLAKYEPRVLNLPLTDPEELTLLLAAAGLFKKSLELCKLFELSCVQVFDFLTRRCIRLSLRVEEFDWNWLVENDVQDMIGLQITVSEVAWALLKKYLEKYEEAGSTKLHSVVCKRILLLKYFLPYWLYASYKKKNPSELLTLLHHTGRLRDAAILARDYILAVLGHGKEHFDFKYSMVPTGPPVSTPLYKIAMLLEELRTVNKEHPERPLAKEYAMLKELFEKYLKTAARISSQMCRYKLSTASKT